MYTEISLSQQLLESQHPKQCQIRNVFAAFLLKKTLTCEGDVIGPEIIAEIPYSAPYA